jgi:hypothetical protein
VTIKVPIAVEGVCAVEEFAYLRSHIAASGRMDRGGIEGFWGFEELRQSSCIGMSLKSQASVLPVLLLWC